MHNQTSVDSLDDAVTVREMAVMVTQRSTIENVCFEVSFSYAVLA